MTKYRLIIACLLIVLAFLLFNLCNRNRKPIIETFNVDSTTKEDITDELVIALFIEDIAKEVANFYSEYYTGEIAVYNYEVTIVDIGKKEPGFIYVKFGVTPQIGAHHKKMGTSLMCFRAGFQILLGMEYQVIIFTAFIFYADIAHPFRAALL